MMIRGRSDSPQQIEQTVERVNLSIRQGGCTAAFTVEVDGSEQLVIVAEVERRYQQIHAQKIHAQKKSSERRQSLEQTSTEHPLDIEDIIAGIRQSVAEHHDLEVYGVVLLRAGSIPKQFSSDRRRAACREAFLAGTLAVLAESRLILHRSHHYTYQPKAEQWLAALRQLPRQTDSLRLLQDWGQRGLLGLQIPERYGGLELDHGNTMRIFQQLGALDLLAALGLSIHTILGIRPILIHASESTREMLLPLLASGQEWVGFALMEEEEDHLLPAIATKAFANSQGGWQIWGKKIWNGATSRLFNLFVQEVDEVGDHQGISCFVVRSANSEIWTHPLQSHALCLEDVAISDVQRLGATGMGMDIAQDSLQYHYLSIAALCLGGMKRCSQRMMNECHPEQSNHPATLMQLSDLTLAIAAIECLVNQITRRLDQEESVPAELYLACKTSAPEFYWQAIAYWAQVDAKAASQLLENANHLRTLGGSNEILHPFLGAQVIHQGDTLHQFLSHGFHAPGIAENLKSATRQIRDRYTHAIGRFPDQAAASQWADSMAGLVATWAILWAAIGETLETEPSPLLQRAFTWAQLQFEHQLFQALIPMPTEMVLTNTDEMMEVMAEYTGAIGEMGSIEPTQLSPLLPTLLPTQLPAPLPTLPLPSRFPFASTPLQLKPNRSIQTWIIGWISRRLNVARHTIDPQKSWAEYGLNSLMATELMQELGSWFPHSTELHASLFQHFPNIGSLASHLDVRMNQYLVDSDKDHL